MPFCKYCGEEIFGNIPHNCPHQAAEPAAKTSLNVSGLKKLLGALAQHIGIGEANLDYFEKGKKITPDSIELNEGEIPIKQYDLAVLQTKIKLSRAEGRMQLTNKRILFRANGFSPAGKTTYQQEFALDKLDGVEIRKDYRFRFGDLLFGLLVSFAVMSASESIADAICTPKGILPYFAMALVGAASCISFFLYKKKWFTKLLILAAGLGFLAAGPGADVITALFSKASSYNGLKAMFEPVVTALYGISLFMYSFKPNLLVEFKTGGGNAVQIRRKDSFFSQRHEEYSGFAEVMPGRDVEVAIKEIGTIIDDIKTLGDLGVEKWKN